MQITLQTESLNFSVVTSRLVMSRDLNGANSLFGGLLVQWVDEAVGIFVMNVLHTHLIVTKKISEILYNEPSKLGDILEFSVRVKKLGISSITVECKVEAVAVDFDESRRSILDCELVFVKVDRMGRSAPHHVVSPT